MTDRIGVDMPKATCTTEDCAEQIGPRNTSGLCKRCYRRRHYLANGDHERETMARWREENRDYDRQRWAEFYAENRDALVARRRADYAADPEFYNAQSTKWRLAHPERRDAWRKVSPERWALQNRANQNRRRVSPKAEPVDFAAILVRDGMVCHICSLDIPSLAVLHFDHVIPLSKGGPHSAENIRPSHARCNLRKGARLIA